LLCVQQFVRRLIEFASLTLKI